MQNPQHCLINLPVVVVFVKAFGVYFEQTTVVTNHFDHGSKRVYFGNFKVGAVVADTKTFCWQVAAGFVVPVKFVRKAAQKAAALAGNLH